MSAHLADDPAMGRRIFGGFPGSSVSRIERGGPTMDTLQKRVVDGLVVVVRAAHAPRTGLPARREVSLPDLMSALREAVGSEQDLRDMSNGDFGKLAKVLALLDVFKGFVDSQEGPSNKRDLNQLMTGTGEGSVGIIGCYDSAINLAIQGDVEMQESFRRFSGKASRFLEYLEQTCIK